MWGAEQSRAKQWAGSIKGSIRLLQVNVNIDFINTNLWFSQTHSNTHTLYPLMPSLWYKYFIGVLFWDGGYFAQRRHYNGFLNPFSPINYSDVTEPYYAWKCSQCTESGGSCVRLCVCLCVCMLTSSCTIDCYAVNKRTCKWACMITCWDECPWAWSHAVLAGCAGRDSARLSSGRFNSLPLRTDFVHILMTVAV